MATARARVISLLAEGREQNDSLIGSEPLGDPSSSCAEREAMFEETVAERPRVRHSRRKPSAASRSTTTFRPVPILCREGVDPFFDLGMKFDSEHEPIIADVRSSHKSDVFCGRPIVGYCHPCQIHRSKVGYCRS